MENIMNIAVENPSKLIQIKSIGNNENLRNDASLDFYNLDSQFQKTSYFKQKDEILNRNHQQLNRRFIIESLKHDIRVRRFEEKDDSIMVQFNTIEDSLSFYKQYIKMIPMNFLDEFGFYIFFDDFQINDNIEFSHYSKPFSECDADKIDHKDTQLDQKSVSTKTNGILYENTGFHQNVSKEEFNSRIEYFNTLKSLYSKDNIQIKTLFSIMTENQSSSEHNIIYTEIEKNIDFIVKNSRELAVGIATNLLLQKLIKKMNEDQISMIISMIGNDIVPISANKYGAYTIQALIDVCKTNKTQHLICKYFGENGKHLIFHEIGNYSIQKILYFNENYVYELITKNLQTIFNDALGFKVLKNCIPIMKSKRKSIKRELKKLNGNEKKLEELLNLF